MNGKVDKINELIGSLRCELFADRESIQEALDFAAKIATASDNPPAVLTAVYVVLNTVLNKVDEIINEEV